MPARPSLWFWAAAFAVLYGIGVVMRSAWPVFEPYADTLLLWGRSRDGEFGTSRIAVLLQRMAPWATHFQVDGDLVDADALTRQLRHTHRHRPETPGVLARGLEGFALGMHEPEADCGVVSTVFRARRPFHPQRLHDVLVWLSGNV